MAVKYYFLSKHFILLMFLLGLAIQEIQNCFWRGRPLHISVNDFNDVNASPSVSFEPPLVL